MSIYLIHLFLVLTLQVCVSEICDPSTDQDNSVRNNAQACASLGPSTGASSDLVTGTNLGSWIACNALQFANNKAVEDFTCFVRVANVFEGFGCVLTADVEEDLFTARVLVDECGGIVDLIVDDDVEILL